MYNSPYSFENRINPVSFNNPVPDTTTFTMEQRYNNMLMQQQAMYGQQQQQQQKNISDPYTEGSNILNSCPERVKQKILEDKRYMQIDYECEKLIKQYFYSICIPPVLNSQDGRIAFEKWSNIIKQLKEEHMQEYVEKEQITEALLEDPVVQQRLRELKNPNFNSNQNQGISENLNKIEEMINGTV